MNDENHKTPLLVDIEIILGYLSGMQWTVYTVYFFFKILAHSTGYIFAGYLASLLSRNIRLPPWLGSDRDCVQAPEGESQPSTEVDLFISTEKIMVLNTDLKVIPNITHVASQAHLSCTEDVKRRVIIGIYTISNSQFAVHLRVNFDTFNGC